jgi:hypothetical protein
MAATADWPRECPQPPTSFGRPGGRIEPGVSILRHDAVPLTAEQRREAVAALAELLAMWWAEHPTSGAAGGGPADGNPRRGTPNTTFFAD